ncbi:hypothetical protein BDV10DRAFT_157054 [Aspergillus recurvatus]
MMVEFDRLEIPVPSPTPYKGTHSRASATPAGPASTSKPPSQQVVCSKTQSKRRKSSSRITNRGIIAGQHSNIRRGPFPQKNMAEISQRLEYKSIGFPGSPRAQLSSSRAAAFMSHRLQSMHFPTTTINRSWGELEHRASFGSSTDVRITWELGWLHALYM